MSDRLSEDLLDPKDRRPENRLSAYYYSFDSTGCTEIDDVLEAVALAGKMYHSTADWCYDADNPDRESPAECIERIAKRSAAAVAALRARVAELEAPGEVASIHKLRAMVREAAREGYRAGLWADVLPASALARADAIADRVLTEAQPGHQRDSGGPA